jgi:hypothetical protein
MSRAPFLQGRYSQRGEQQHCSASCWCAPLAAFHSPRSGQGEAGAPARPKMPVSAAAPGSCAVRRSLRDRRCGPRTSDGGNMMGAANVVGSENVAQPASCAGGP